MHEDAIRMRCARCVAHALSSLVGASLCALAFGCGSDAKAPATTREAEVVRQYAVNLDANYKDVIATVQVLDDAVTAFVADPSADGLDTARQAWLASRPFYGQCEISRFYGGPMDAAQGDMNEWPIDENFIDYTSDNPMAGIINMPVAYPEIAESVLRAADERGGIENLATGYHAIEFLLWGQRPDQTGGPGERPYTDYQDGGTAANQDRRRLYLKSVVDMLLEDMQALDAQWDLANADTYGAQMIQGPAHAGLTNLVRGFTNLGISELLFERLEDPYVTQDRKDEESCFSESTIIDLKANALGVENVYLGRYGDLQGPSVSDLVKAKNPNLDSEIKNQLSAARAALDAIPPPFDHAVLSPVGSDANLKARAAIDAFLPMQSSFEQMATLLNVPINL